MRNSNLAPSHIPVFRAFFRDRRTLIVLVLAFVVYLSFSTLLTKPRLWNDEAKSIEIAKSFALHGSLDIEYAPGAFTENAALLQSTGYPVTVPLALLYKIFGVSYPIARAYMVLWMVAALLVGYHFVSRVFGTDHAVLSLMLLSLFASFYDSGRTVVGEIPGFVFLLWGLYVWIQKKSLMVAGILFGVAVVAKPSVFGLIIPAALGTMLFQRHAIVRQLCYLCISMLPAALLWFALVGVNPFASATWQELASFYSNPYGGDVIGNVIANLKGFIFSSTLVYFSMLFLCIAVARWYITKRELVMVYDFTIIYAVLAFIYYLRSPGWLRYILIAELLILLVAPHAILTVLHAIKSRLKYFMRMPLATATTAAVVLLILIQGVHLFTMADIFAGDRELRLAEYIVRRYPKAEIGVLGSVELCALIERAERRCIYEFAGIPIIGENPLLQPSLPAVIFSRAGNRFENEGRSVLDSRYERVRASSGFYVYELRP